MSSNALAAFFMLLLILMVLGISVGNAIYDGQNDVSITTPAPTSTSTTTTTTVPSDCLCIFDIDRTLTGKQGEMEKCQDNQIQTGIIDDAYTGGELTLSQLSQFLSKTFCSECYLGIISAGHAGPNEEREDLYDKLDVDQQGHPLPTNEDAWGDSCTSEGKPLLLNCPDGNKPTGVPTILKYYQDTGVNISDDQVFFFDDRPGNIDDFKGINKYNAKQISCDTRDESDPTLGLCGATVEEITRFTGFALCEDAVSV